jgi:hypothetical protein
LRVFKGGATGVAEIRRMTGTAASRTWPSIAEFASVHYEQLRTEGGSGLEIGPSGQPGYKCYLDGVIDPPLKASDKLYVNGLIFSIKQVDEVGNNTPISSVICEVVQS